MAIRKRRNRRRLTIAVVVVGIIVVLGLFAANIVSLKKEQHEAVKMQQELKSEKAQLEKELDNINDTSNIEEQARSQLKLIKPGEILYMFPDTITEKDVDDSAGDSGK